MKTKLLNQVEVLKKGNKASKKDYFTDFIPVEFTVPDYWVDNNVFSNIYFDTPYVKEIPLPKQETKEQDIVFVYETPRLYQPYVKTKFTDYRQSNRDNFIKQMNLYGDSEYNDWFEKTAALESAFVQNPTQNKTHSGWFQLNDKYIPHYTGIPTMTRAQFENDPRAQFIAAKNLAKENLTQIRRDKSVQAFAKKHGYSDWDLLAGAWLVGFGGLKDYITKGVDKADVNGTKVSQRINNFKNMSL